ncbi:hypothetical protein PG102015_0272 [Bifidobacterium pseudolongum subsp. globosum]|uniref:hypothetical protein n=1 Tax=Bifidobacterium pseudolongum TaxID=1694 RepID=UPI00101EAF21|nr:hypothetical protein [Bifidobacterium pseudolongum]RYP97265.1 hypothetical protein PG102015_0272 [Bifidobacterium pseudolongum subsp. globosum]
MSNQYDDARQDAATAIAAGVQAANNVQAAPDVPAAPGNDYRKPGLSRNARRTRQIKRLREENEMLHRRLAAIYDALTLQ